MRLLSYNPGHDGAVALIEDGRLMFSFEAEKNSFERHDRLSADLLMKALERSDGPPDVVAIGGWHKHLTGHFFDIGAGYAGLDPGELRSGRLLGHPVSWFSSSHERSHLHMAAAMGPAAPYEDCAILVWEGFIGALYRWQDGGRRLSRLPVLSEPGGRYAALLALADPDFPDSGGYPRTSAAGKVMALAAYARGAAATSADVAAVDQLLALPTTYPLDKAAFRNTPLHGCGVHTPTTHRAAAKLGDRIFDRFREAAERWLPRGLPLLIAGGCGLNCEWNSRWLTSGLFSDVFVAPCADDSGSAIGTAMDALCHLGAPCRLEWDAYRGAPFTFDQPAPSERWSSRPLAESELATKIASGDVVAWVEGCCEIGPRALGHRSLLATPLDGGSRERLNEIKGREDYRPIAPCCLSEDLSTWFSPAIDDPHMLYFSFVTTDRLPAVTHVDGTSRVQSVRPDGPQRLRRLLAASRQATGVAVLCNTSLNFPGRGFINTNSELFVYAEQIGIEHVVVDGLWHERRSNL